MNKQILNPGIVLGLAVVVFSAVTMLLGWYKNPNLGMITLLVFIAIEVAVLVWGLRATAADRGYGGQVIAGLLMAIIGAIIIFLGSLILTPMLAPDYPEIARVQQEMQLAEQGMSDAEIEQMLDNTAMFRTPMFGAISGAIMTVLTGLVISLITAAFIRRKE